ncbi:hypothetical protein V7S43_015978 [Phytophthora oleae]|uniref:Uncharacterized protein n=1 Tax=Phytophthora oleae TaxID=2107226 RepID=A0ABD3F0W3_9STRA
MSLGMSTWASVDPVIRGVPGLKSNEVSDESSNYSIATQPSETDENYSTSSQSKPFSDAELLARARDLHRRIDFHALAAGPNAGGPWKRVEAADRFVLFRDEKNNVPEVLCAGRIDAAIEEIGSILCPQNEGEHNAVMTALHEKRFLFGSLERSVACKKFLLRYQEVFAAI